MTVSSFRPGNAVRFTRQTGEVVTGVIDRIAQVNYKIRATDGRTWNYRRSAGAGLTLLSGQEAESVKSVCRGHVAVADRVGAESREFTVSIPMPELGRKVRCTPPAKAALEGVVIKQNTKTFRLVTADGQQWNVGRQCPWQYVS